MNNQIMPFAFDDALVRVHMDETGEPWFVAKDVCSILDLGNPRSSIALLEDDEKGVHTVDTLGGKQEMSTVSESGLYTLVIFKGVGCNYPLASTCKQRSILASLDEDEKGSPVIMDSLGAQEEAHHE